MTARPPTPDILDLASWRLLRWLERYPFQRAGDMLVALAPFAGRSTLYQRLANLEQRHLIETWHLGGRKSALYTLSPRGQHACAQWARATREPLSVRDEREHLFRLLPRLPVWLVLQDLVNGLVEGAAQALRQQGRTATMIQWNWQRDATHTFHASQEQEMIARVDGALAFRLRFATQTVPSSDEWYSLILLYCPLDDIRVLRQRLERLLRWHEASARRASDRPMPTLAILATTPRQAEWWHLAAAQVARKLHTQVLCGAIASVPPGAIGNGWRLRWRRLDTTASCHLQDLLAATTMPTMPELAGGTLGTPIHQAIRQARQPWSLPASGHRQTYRPTSTRGKTSTDYRLTSLRLTPRQWDILLLCFAHPLLSTEDLVAFLPPGLKPMQALLRSLQHMGYLVATRTVVGQRWHLAEEGLRLLASFANCHIQRFLHLPIVAHAPLQQRGVKGLLHQIQHTAGMYGFFATLATELASQPNAHLRWWETGARCERVFGWRNTLYHFKPDAFAGVQIAGKPPVRFWLEYDRGTMFVRDLESKCATYAAFLSSREWALGSAIPPLLLVVVPEMAQEQRFTRTAQALLTHIAGLRLYTTTFALLLTRGILGPIWQLRLPFPEHQRRIALFGSGEEASG